MVLVDAERLGERVEHVVLLVGDLVVGERDGRGERERGLGGARILGELRGDLMRASRPSFARRASAPSIIFWMCTERTVPSDSSRIAPRSVSASDGSSFPSAFAIRYIASQIASKRMRTSAGTSVCLRAERSVAKSDGRSPRSFRRSRSFATVSFWRLSMAESGTESPRAGLSVRRYAATASV